MTVLYYCWAFVRQSLIKAGLFAENAAFDLSGGKLAKHLFNRRVGAEHIGTSVGILKEDSCSTDIAKLDAEGNITDDDFLILSSTDFHLEGNTTSDEKTLKLFIRQIKEAKPDLVVLTGDTVVTDYEQIDAVRFADMMERLGIYWAAVFGNHEVREEKSFYKWLLLKDFADRKHCLCRHGDDKLFGYGNFTINIMGKSGLRKTLYFFDSGRDIGKKTAAEYKLPSDMKGYDFLKKEQIAFYENNSERLKQMYGHSNSLMYMHIPLCEYKNVFDEIGKHEYRDSGKCELLYGEQYESVGCSPYNSGMFEAILRHGTQAVFAGHDHINDWCAIYKGVRLVYSLSGGYSAYHLGTALGKPETEWQQGVTLTTITADGSLDIRPVYNRKYLTKEICNEK